jgi:glyoxylate carboligase
LPAFDVLHDEGPDLIVCRHEQNAAFMAAAVGRLTGRPGVCLVTSGPGTGDLVTGAATAWQKQTVRGFVSILRSKGGEKTKSSKNASGESSVAK